MAEEKIVKKEHLEAAMRMARQDFRAKWQTITLSASAWSENADITGYGYSCDVPLTGATAADSAESVIQPGSLAAASDCGLCATSEIGDGSIRYYAKAVPASDIVLQVRIIGGPINNVEEGG